MSGTYAVKRPVAWVGGIVLLALIVLAIVLPITARKKEDVVISSFQGHYPKFAPFSNSNDPFTLLTDEQKERANTAFRSMSAEQKRGHINVYPTDRETGLQTGPPVPGFDDHEELVTTGKVGAFLNFVDPDEIRTLQEYATGSRGQANSQNSGYPLMMGFDVIHGYATIFPVNLGMASAFDPEMIYDHAKWAALEALSVGINWNYNPMLDVGRDPRWGRVSEGSGEDAYLVGTLGYQYIRGYQENGMAACVKHVGAYGVTRAGRDYTSGEVGRLTLFNEYFEAYRRAFKAKPLTAMASFNSIFRSAAHMNRELLQDILRGQWGFDGFVVADWSGPTDMFAMRVVEPNLTLAGRASLEAGVDMNMADMAFWEGLEARPADRAPTSGRSYNDHIDLAVKRVLAVKERMGIYDNFNPREIDLPHPDAMDAAEIAAIKSAVLLKNGEFNGEKVLPLTNDAAKELWLVGKIANTSRDHQGSWSSSGIPYTDDVVTVLDSLEDFRGPSETGNWKYFDGYDTTWRGTHTNGDETEDDDDYLEATKMNEVVEAFRNANPKPETVVFVVGENCNQNGEGTSRTNLTMSGSQLTMVKRIHALNQAVANPNQRSKLVYVVMAGRPLTIPWEAENLDAILYAWNNGSRGGPAIWKLLFGQATPSGKLPITMPRSVGQIPINYQFHGSRAPLGRDQWDDILDPHYCLWEDNKPTHNRYPWGGRCYMASYIDSPISPLYWFGYGLSYSNFTYANVEVREYREPGNTAAARPIDQMGTGNIYENHPNITISLSVRRGGRRDLQATEIVQVYIRDLRASVMPAWKNLRGYTRVDFPPNTAPTGEYDEQTASIDINVYEDFGFWNEAMEWVVEPGRFEIIVARNSLDEDHIIPFYVIDTSGRSNVPLGAHAD